MRTIEDIFFIKDDVLPEKTQPRKTFSVLKVLILISIVFVVLAIITKDIEVILFGLLLNFMGTVFVRAEEKDESANSKYDSTPELTSYTSIGNKHYVNGELVDNLGVIQRRKANERNPLLLKVTSVINEVEYYREEPSDTWFYSKNGDGLSVPRSVCPYFLFVEDFFYWYRKSGDSVDIKREDLLILVDDILSLKFDDARNTVQIKFKTRSAYEEKKMRLRKNARTMNILNEEFCISGKENYNRLKKYFTTWQGEYSFRYLIESFSEQEEGDAL